MVCAILFNHTLFRLTPILSITRKEDAATSYERLEVEKGKVKAPLVVQEVSFSEIMSLFETGGFESRALEFYPSIAAIEAATGQKID